MIMNCKHCGALLQEEEQVCSACGQAVEPETEVTEEVVSAAEEAVAEETAEEAAETAEEEMEDASEDDADEAAEEEEAAEDESEEETNQPVKKQSNAGLIIALVACLAAIAVLVFLLVDGKRSMEGSGEGAAVVEVFKPEVSYVKDKASAFNDRLLDRVIASCGDSTLTNRHLPYYYWGEFYAYYNNNSSSLSGVMNPLMRLDQQSYDTVQSWDQFIMDYALSAYHTWGAAAAKARTVGHQLTQEEQEYLAGRYDEMAAYAEENGIGTVEDYLHLNFGPYCTYEDYMSYLEEYFLGASYVEYLVSTTEYTADEIKAFYEENKDYFNYYGVTEDDTLMVDVRHILIKPEAVSLKEGEEGYEEAVQEARDAAKAKAEEIYNSWLKSGNPTEESFAELAKEHSADGSAANGGLYEQVYPGRMVEPFEDWCFDESRQVGDHGIVETQYGFHIMYYSKQWDESLYHLAVTSELSNETYYDVLDALRAEYPLEKDLKHAAIYPVNTELQ